MKVNVSIGGVATSAARMRGLALVREAIIRREADAARGQRQSAVEQADRHQQLTRGK